MLRTILTVAAGVLVVATGIMLLSESRRERVQKRMQELGMRVVDGY